VLKPNLNSSSDVLFRICILLDGWLGRMMSNQNIHSTNHVNSVQKKKMRHITAMPFHIDHINNPTYKEQTLVKQVKKK